MPCERKQHWEVDVGFVPRTLSPLTGHMQLKNECIVQDLTSGLLHQGTDIRKRIKEKINALHVSRTLLCLALMDI